MKKLALAVAMSVLMVSAVTAAPIKGGLKVGLGLSTLTGADTFADASSKLGFAAGAFADFGVSPSFSVQPEVLYATKGTQSSIDSAAKWNLTYINIPVLAKLKLGNLKASMVPTVFAGPQLGLLLSSKMTNGTNDVDMKDVTNSTDFAVVLGAGLDIQKFSLDVRYDLGLTSLGKTVAGVSPKIYNGTVLLSAGYSFN